MKVTVTKNHPGEGQFPSFKKGTDVNMVKEECNDFKGWYPCEIAGHKTYIPGIFVKDGKLTRDYDPTELVQETGDVLHVQEIVYACLFAKNESEKTGWIPAESVISFGLEPSV